MPDKSQPEKTATVSGSATGVGERPQIPDHELLSPIGNGSYGDIWLAKNVMGSFRAVKLVYRKSFDNDRPYEREFSGIKKFEPISRSHEGFVDILQVGRNDQEGYFYYVMELADDAAELPQVERENESRVEGGPPNASPSQLSTQIPLNYSPKTLRSEVQGRGRLPSEECLQLTLSLTSALGQLHRQGLIHRDIKPSNIIFVHGQPKLADIGLVASVTEAKSFVGTEGFIPPEGPGSPQADLYSLGKVLYEMSTGKDRTDFPELPTLLREMPNRQQLIELNEVVLKACQNDLQKRYQSAEEMHADLALLQSGKSVKHLRVVERRLTVLTRIGIAALLLTALAIGGSFFEEMRARHAEQRQEETQRLLRRAEYAEHDATEKLWGSYLAQARANRWSGREGRRFDALEVLAKAAAIRPSLELRNEAIAAMALSDVKVARQWLLNPTAPQGQAFALDADRHRYAQLDATANISIRRLEDHSELFNLPGAGQPANSILCFSPDGQFLAEQCSARRTNQFRIWHLGRREVLWKLLEGVHQLAVAFSPDSRLIAVADEAGMIRLYDLTNRTELASLRSLRSPSFLCFRPMRSQLAVCSDESSSIETVDLVTGQSGRSFSGSNTFRGIAWSPDGSVLAGACSDHRVHLWNADSGEEKASLEGHTAEVTAVAFNHLDDLLVSYGWDGHTRLWDPKTGQPLLTIPGEFLRFNPFSTNDRTLGFRVSGSVGFWELAAAREFRRIGRTGPLWAADFAPDGRLLGTASSDGVRIWDWELCRQLGVLAPVDSRSVLFLPDGNGLITSGLNGVQRWPVRSSQTADAVELRIGPPEEFLHGPFEEACLGPDGHTVAVAQPANPQMFDLQQPGKRVLLKDHPNAARTAFSPDGRLIATSTWHGTGVKVWDSQSGQSMLELPMKGSAAVAFSPNGRWLVTGSADEYRFWEVGSWRPGLALPRDRAGDMWGSIVFSRDGTLLALLHGRARGLQLLDAVNRRELAMIDAGKPLCFSPDGSQLVAAGHDGGVQVWDLRLIRQQLATMRLDWDLPPYPSMGPAPAPTAQKVTLINVPNY